MKELKKERRYSFTIMDLVIAFISPRQDHPGRKAGCPHRRGSFHGKITRVKR